MKWEQLICVERQQEKAEKSKEFKQFDLNEFDDDYLSIISSQAFRRLQDKTQVFPLDKSDFVRTRLTHSMEVSTIARHLAEMIASNSFRPAEIRADPMLGRKIATIAACAGLLHDTGNPPFGHYGEEVMRDWFRRRFADESFCFRGVPVGKLLRDADPAMTADFENFEGNAQGLRILSKAGLRTDSHDVNLTYAVMNTLIKYPNPSTDFDKRDPDVKRHKPGYYYAEREIMDKICTATGTKTDSGYVRHPIVYIMEAADDIAYATADLADSVKKGRFTVREFIDFYEAEADAYTDAQLREFIAAHRSSETLGAKMDRYLELHLLMRAESYTVRRLMGSPDEEKLAIQIKALKAQIAAQGDERAALFQTAEEKELLKELEAVKGKAKQARNMLNPLRKAITTQGKETAQRSGGNSVLRRALFHSDTPEVEFAIFENWLEYVRMWLMYDAQYSFTRNYVRIMAGDFPDDILENNNGTVTLRILKKAMAVNVYDAQEIISLEVSAKTIMESLLDDFIRAVMYADEPDEADHMTTIDDRFIHMIPDNFKMDYLGAKEQVEARVAAGQQTRENADAEELYLRFLMVTDFISGMTDSYARNLYRITNGMD